LIKSCEYLAKHFAGLDTSFNLNNENDENKDTILESCICMCDDDNDLEMAAACGKVFLPSIASKSMQDAVNRSPEKFIVTENELLGITEMISTEHSLRGVIAECQSRKSDLGPLRP
jgi:hypothetical protein